MGTRAACAASWPSQRPEAERRQHREHRRHFGTVEQRRNQHALHQCRRIAADPRYPLEISERHGSSRTEAAPASALGGQAPASTVGKRFKGGTTCSGASRAIRAGKRQGVKPDIPARKCFPKVASARKKASFCRQINDRFAPSIRPLRTGRAPLESCQSASRRPQRSPGKSIVDTSSVASGSGGRLPMGSSLPSRISIGKFHGPARPASLGPT